MLGWWDKRLVDQASDVSSFFLFIIFYRFSALKTLYSNFCNLMKGFFQKIILGTSDPWLMSHLSHWRRTSVSYCRLSDLWSPFCLKLWFLPLTRLARCVPSLKKASFLLVARKASQKRRHFFWSHSSKWLFFCLFCFPSSSKHRYHNVQFKKWLYDVSTRISLHP